MSKFKLVFIAVPLIILSACSNPGMEKETSKNGVTAELIAEVDGCRVWRIDPGGVSKYVYMSRCPEGAATTQRSVSCGKNCTTTQYNLGARAALASTGGEHRAE